VVLRIGSGVQQGDPRRVKYLAIRPQMSASSRPAKYSLIGLQIKGTLFP
jgi:hypothetical protein